MAHADFVVPIEIDGVTHNVYVMKRPHVDEFLQRMGELYEIVLFTASLSKVLGPRPVMLFCCSHAGCRAVVAIP